MSRIEIISLIVTFIGVTSFAAIFTILYRSHTFSLVEYIQLGKKEIDLIDLYLYESQEKVKKRKKNYGNSENDSFLYCHGNFDSYFHFFYRSKNPRKCFND